MSQRFKIAAALLAVALLSAGVSYGILNYQQRRETLQDTKERLAKYLSYQGIKQDSVEFGRAAGHSASQAVVGRDTILSMKTIYDCGHEEIEIREAPTEMLGLTREELQKECEGWEIVEFSPGRVTLLTHKSGMAPKCQNTMHLGIKDGFVAVFHGSPDARCRLKSVTQIPVSGLPLSEKKDLDTGIPIASEEQLLKILEGLAESRTP